MANMPQAKTDEELKSLTVSNVKKAYSTLAQTYDKILENDLVYCPHCGTWKAASNFYTSNKTKSGLEHFACKSCILDMCTDYDPRTKIRTDNKEKTLEVFERLDWYFNEATYLDQLKTINEDVGEKVRSTAVQQWIVMYKSLPNWKGLTWKDSIFSNDDVLELSSSRKPRKEILKTFGSGFTNEDYLYLQDQYDDWKSRTQVDSKSQETYIIQICFKQLEIWKAQKSGKNTDKLVKSLNDLMNGANLQPRQNVGNAATDSLTFGQLIEKWELEKPIPEPQNEFKDPDNIGKFLRVWFKGSLMRALGLDGGYSKEYDDYVEQYTIEKPTNIDDDDSVDESMYAKVFGKEE